MIAQITKTFQGDDGELWCEARAEEQLVFKFRAPAEHKLAPGDALAFDRSFLDQKASVPVFKLMGNAVVSVRASDTKDLRDRRIVADLTFQPTKSRVLLRATGEPETEGIFPGCSVPGSARFDDLNGLERYVKSVAPQWLEPEWDAAGSREVRQALLDWLSKTAIPQLRAAERHLREGK